MPNKQGPILTIRDGALSASIWTNQSVDGKPFHSVSFARTYTDSDGNAQSGHSFSGSDILKLSRLAERAYDRIAEFKTFLTTIS